MAISYVVYDHDYGKVLTDRAVALNPNFSDAWRFAGWVRIWLGEPEGAIECVNRALRLNPNDPHSFSMYCAMSMAHLSTGRYAEARSWSEMGLREKPEGLLTLAISAATNALAGRSEDAQQAVARLRLINPSLRLSNVKDIIPIVRPEDIAKWSEGLQLAGMPE
jgi:tetratricopeptide (TPR) repeat protein